MTSPLPWGALCMHVASVNATPHSDPEHLRAMIPRLSGEDQLVFSAPPTLLLAVTFVTY